MLLRVILPICSSFLIISRIARSLTCKVIKKTNLTDQPLLTFLFLLILITNEPSASMKPASHRGNLEFFCKRLEQLEFFKAIGTRANIEFV